MFKKRSYLIFISVLIMLVSVSVNILADDTNDDWLHVEGNRIVDKDGNPVWLTGTNWFGFNTGSNMFDGLWACNLEEAIRAMANRGINLLRVPVSTEILHNWSQGIYPPPGSLNDYVNPELAGMNSFEIFDKTVELCKKYGMKIMVDVHSPASEAMGHIYPLWYNETFTTEIWISSQVWLADYYKDDDTIIAFDIENEPHGTPNPDSNDFAKWDDSTDINNWKHAAETCAKGILAANPNLLIVVEGIEAYPKPGYDYTAIEEWGQESKYYYNWWGGNLRGVKDYPLDLGEHQDQLVYSPHDYGPSVHRQSWFYEGFNMESLYNDCWKDNWAYIMEDNTAPLLIGEWGGFMDGGDNEKWMKALRDYMIENKIHHTFWCFNANSGDTGGLVMHDFQTWDEAKYELLKPALWQDSNGRFVSLDHQRGLGEDGTNVTEYYQNGGKPPVPPTGGGGGGDVMPGDLNDDGNISAVDYTLLRRYLLGNEVDISEEAADINEDGDIGSLDYTLLQRYLLGQIDTL